MSVLSMLLCFTMLIGTTFAWFTDEVTSTGNKIVAGKLDVKLYKETIDMENLFTNPLVEEEITDSSAPLFSGDIIWEPGYAEVVNLKLENNGNLALKWQASLHPTTEVGMLAEVIDVYVLYGEIINTANGRDYYADKVELVGTLEEILNGDAILSGELKEAGEVCFFSIVMKMQESAGNEYQEQTAGEFDIHVLATQLAYESDSFDDKYDDDSEYPTLISTAGELAAALTEDKENINVILANDIDLPINTLGQQTGGSGEYKLGGASTKYINIDLNGKKLNITTSYWSGIGAKNDDAVINIKNGTMTSSQATGTWNSYDVTFANCNYVIENVTFDKAIAFTNAGKSVILNNVTINETHDYYAMWISAKGQTVEINGLTVNSAGRGIKIDEQYVSAPELVTLKVSNATFNTAKKAAVLVKSAAGADITVSNVNIANVEADTTNVVWVDADATAYADLVTVTGATVIVEP